jgi:hypothetical protein
MAAAAARLLLQSQTCFSSCVWGSAFGLTWVTPVGSLVSVTEGFSPSRHAAQHAVQLPGGIGLVQEFKAVPPLLG